MRTEKFRGDLSGMPLDELAALSEEHMQDMMMDVQPRWMGFAQAVEAEKKGGRDPNLLTKQEWDVIAFLARGPNTIENVRRELDMSIQQEHGVREKVKNKGLVQEAVEIIGNKKVVVALSAKGEDKARERGYFIRKYKSGAIHETILTEVEKSPTKSIPGASCKRKDIAFGNVQPDSLLMFPGKEGGRAAIQAVCSPNIAHEINNVMKLHAVDELDFIVLVAAKAEIKKSLDKALRQAFNDNVPGRIRILDIQKILASKCDWADEFDGE